MANNTDHMEYIKNLAIELEKNGKYLSERRNAIDNLRKIQQLLSSWEYDSHRDHNIEFLAFFLRSFIEKVLYNLIRDITFSEGFAEEEQNRFCKIVGETLSNLSMSLQEPNSEFYPYCVKLSIAYLDAVKAINKRVSGSEAQRIE